MKRFLLALIISLTISSQLALAYNDVPKDHPAYEAIEYLRMNDVFKEAKNFQPGITITKAEFIKYLVILNSPDFKPKKNAVLPFDDTKDNAWYTPYFYEAIRLGILSDRDKVAEPYRKLTIFDALELLFHSRSIPIPKTHTGKVPYKDVERNARITPLIMRSVELGIVEPQSDDYFGIYRRVTRAMAAEMIYNMDMVNVSEESKPKLTITIGQQDPALQKIVSAWDIVHSNYLYRDDLDDKQLSDDMLTTLAEDLKDPYTAYLNEQDNSAFSDDLDGEIEGIGAFISQDDNGNVVVVSPIDDSPAQRAGLMAGDFITKIDGEPVDSKNLNAVVNKIKGPKGTQVKLTINRGGAIMDITVTRDVISLKSVTYEVLNNQIMYIRLIQFNTNAAKEFRDVVDIILGNPKIKGVIIDMRNNPGGLLEVSNEILGTLIPRDSVTVNIEYSYFNYTYNSQGDGELSKYPMAVLINKGSASASEIVAGALKDYKLATIIGETSFGKGTVQEVNFFGDSTSFKLTVAKWLTPNGLSIQKNGIEPDITIVNGAATTTDNQLDKAIDEVSKKIR